MRKEFAGAANRAELAADISAVDNTITLVSAAGWPTGASAPFVLRITRSTDWYQEKVLCSARTGGIVTVQTRGYDGTTASTFVAGDIVEHVLDAVTVDEANEHANSPHGAVLYSDINDSEVSRSIFVLGTGAPEPTGLVQGDVVIDQRGSAGSDDSGWILPTFTNGWTDYGAGFSGVAYRKIGLVVYLRGMISSGTTNTYGFTLPVGFRPNASRLWKVHGHTGSAYLHEARIQINPDGGVSINGVGGAGQHAALDTISFPADA